MKPSKYNLTIDNAGEYIIYNTLHDRIMLCQPEIIPLLQEHAAAIDRLESIHPTLFAYMKEKQFLVPDDEDETQTLIAGWQAEDTDDSHYSITINPTLNCNLACWYCYEEHRAGSRMTSEVFQAVKRLIHRILTNGKTKTFHLSFFGGEPLLGFRDCVKPLIEYTHALCREAGIELTLGFTTNAVLLTEEVTDFLASTGLPVDLQIPFDGNREVHNSIKKTHSGEGTYDRTLDNLKYAIVLSKNISVRVRCNYTNDTIHSFEGLIEDLMPTYRQYGERLYFAFHQVWQDPEKKETEEIVSELEKKVAESGGKYDSPALAKTRCYADKKHSFVINYNGDVYQCTAREFDEANREGKLLEDGTIQYNERYEKRMDCRFSNPACLACYAFPICNLCSQKRLEHDNTRCIYADPATGITDMIRNRIVNLYRLTHPDKPLHIEQSR